MMTLTTPGPLGAGPLPQSREVPVPVPVKLWLCSNDALSPAVAGVLAAHWLDEGERETAARFLFERDRRQYLLAHTLVRRALALEAGLAEAEQVIWRSARGRPFLQPLPGGLPRGGGHLDFNLSHAGGYSLLGIVRSKRIGVDVEGLAREARALETILTTFTAEEQGWVLEEPAGERRSRRVLRLWTLKEAYSKARGLGLALPFDEFSFTLAGEGGVLAFRPPADDGDGRWRFVELEPVPGVLSAVALPADDGLVPYLELHHGFPWDRATPRVIALPEPVGASPAPHGR
ncbi:4'-phosphopantetheinyl transferase family protein [Streptomyces sp. NPDC005551]|uniref:4'-phosphopantetheinyl transferase family protein n=1 Tax=Streptomyces sp. NPDC005551 TaxID=3364725 RepID=UPI0036C4FFE8